MGNPLNFSMELPQRCLLLIDELWEHAEKTRQSDRPDLGSLTTTFLLSMSSSIINIPIERIERHRDTLTQGYADDRHIDVRATTTIIETLGGRRFDKAPFHAPGAWSFVSVRKEPFFNLADALPEDLASELSSSGAIKSAAAMETSQWCSVLRNALAHGGIAYLNAQGRSSFGEPVRMYLFVSGRYDREGANKLVGLNLLRIAEDDYRVFLRKWVEWLSSTATLRGG